MRLALLIVLLLPLQGLRAQVSELGITGGVTYYIGDINPYKHYPARMKPMGGLLFRYNFGSRYAVRAQALYGTLEAFDSDSPDSLQQLRNLSFRANIFELALLGEINFFHYRAGGKDGRSWTPFVFAGLCYFRANPRAQLDNTWYDLQPLGTEGQGGTSEDGGGSLYKVDQVGIPFGAGLKFALGKRVDLQLEWGLRRTFTDYLDDVSGTYADPEQLNPLAAELSDPSLDAAITDRTGQARGDTQTRDWYQYTGLSLSVLLTKFTECDQLYFRMKR
ncbi:MAG: PorT family protein [Flavobacteriales bacterium]|nr:PorT family protein [Flavobacteriales bacterium]MBP6698309.1 PorT family protein [Flavobacteriales bacterium]